MEIPFYLLLWYKSFENFYLLKIILWILKLLQCQPPLEENESVTPHDGSASAMAARFLVNLDLEVPDTFRPPPAPLPYDVVLGCPQSTDSESFRETLSRGSFETLPTCEDLEESDCKTESGLLLSPRKSEVSKLTESKESTTEEEDACPICLEGNVISLPKALIASKARSVHCAAANWFVHIKNNGSVLVNTLTAHK